jgi:hypothetical protein
MKSKGKKSKKVAVKKTSKKKARPKRGSALEGEGSYTAARNYDRETESFIAKNRSKITKMAKDAESALQSPEGKKLRAAEKIGKSKARR